MKKKSLVFRHLLCVLFMLTVLGNPVAWAGEDDLVIVKYGFDDVVAAQGGRVDQTTPPQCEHLTFSSFAAVGDAGLYGLSDNSSTKEQFSFSGWSVNTNLNFDNLSLEQALSALDKSQYYEFTLTPDQGYALQIAKFSFKLGRTATGPRLFALSSSADNHSSLLPLAFGGTSASVRVLDNCIFVWADEANTLAYHQCRFDKEIASPVTFRFYAWAAENDKGKFVIDNVELQVKLRALQDGQPTSPDDASQTENAEKNLADTVIMTQPQAQWPVLADTTSIVLTTTGAQYRQTISMPWPSVDAVVNLYNPKDSARLYVEQPAIRVQDAFGQDRTNHFRWFSDKQLSLEPQTSQALLFSLYPQRSVYESDSLRFTLDGSFVSYYDESQKQNNVMYPQAFSLRSVTAPKIMYVLPEDTGALVLRIYNNAAGGQLLPMTWNWTKTSQETATGQILEENREIAAGSPWFSQWRYDWCQVDSLQDISIRTADEYVPDIELYTLLKGVENKHLLSVSQTDSARKDTMLLMDDGRNLSVQTTRQFLEEKWVNDSSLCLSYLPASNQVLLLGYDIDAHMDSLQLENVQLGNDVFLSDAYYWQDDQQYCLLDTAARADTLHYQLNFSYRLRALESIFVHLYDSICLGDIYQANGFDLPAQEQPGDFLFVDSLLAVNGADSIVNLHLNVCDKPAMPEEIFGDSLIVSAGTYLYTIKPVPSAAFYVWTVMPGNWTLDDSQSTTMSLSIPYPGEGRISVKAVNRCGASQDRTLQLQDATLTDLPTASFHVLPGASANSFSLQMQGLTGKTTIAVYDMAGKLMFKESKTSDGSEEIFEINLEDYVGGMYMISIVNEAYQSATLVRSN